MREIGALAARYGFRVIEDASHAIGGRYLGEPVGNCRYSDITVFSFHPVKIITTGEGGMALTKDLDLAEKLRRFAHPRHHPRPARMVGATEGPWYYQQIELGFNYRMTTSRRAGYSQLQRLDELVARRHELADRYDALLVGLPVITPWRDPDAWSAFHLYVIRLDERPAGRTRRAVLRRCASGDRG